MSIQLVTVGDLMLTRPVDTSGAPEVWRGFREADLVFANLEVPLTDRGYPADKAIAFRSPPALATEFARLGIDVLSIANNHGLDFGTEGLLQTLEVVRGAGTAIVGGGATAEEAFRPAIFTRDGLKVAFLGMACTLPPGYGATAVRPGIAPIRVISQFVIDAVSLDEQPGCAPYVRTWALEDDVAAACAAVRRARSEADLVVIGIHWGVPNGWVAQFQDPLAEYQRPLGQALVEAGAHLVVGHHPHTLHGIERHGDGWILYSVGNFLFHSVAGPGLTLSRTYPPYRLESLQGREAAESAIFAVRLSAAGVEEIALRPMVMNGQGEPELLQGAEARTVLERVDRLSRGMGVSVSVEGERGVVVAR